MTSDGIILSLAGALFFGIWQNSAWAGGFMFVIILAGFILLDEFMARIRKK